MLEPIYIFWSLQIAVFGYVVTCVLTEQNMLLSRYDDILIDLEAKHKWLAYPLGRCEKCFTGQVALWVWLHIKHETYLENAFIAFVNHCVFVAFSILFVILIKKFLR